MLNVHLFSSSVVSMPFSSSVVSMPLSCAALVIESIKVIFALISGCGADNDSGDGAGVMTAIPWDLFDQWAREQGLGSFDKSHTGVGMVFLPRDETLAQEAKRVVVNTFAEEGVDVIAWRSVPINVSVVGRNAKETMPNIQQVFVRIVKEESIDDIERELYICRKLIEKAASSEPWASELYFCSLSNQTIVYKGMLRSEALGMFYADLQTELLW